MTNSIILILYLGVTNSIVNKNDKKKENKNKNKNKSCVNDNKNKKNKEEKRLYDNKIIKTLPPIPEAGLLALQVIFDDNDNNQKIIKDE